MMRSRLAVWILVGAGISVGLICAPTELTAQAEPASRPSPDPLYDGTVAQRTPGLTNPIMVTAVRPTYTAEAKRLKIQGTVQLLARVEPDGKVTYAEVSRSVDSVHGLDVQAIKAAKQWRFRPAKLNGKAVSVVITLELEFRLH